MSPRPFLLPPPEAAPAAALLVRARDFLLRTWRGRVLLAALLVAVLDDRGLPLPDPLVAVGWLLLAGFAVYGTFRLLRRLLWRIRTKLILSYLFMAVVPLLLLGLFFVVAAVLFSGLVGSYLVSTELADKALDLQAAARGAMAVPSPSDASSLEARLGPARAVHPELAYALIRQGKTVAASGDLPRLLPSWWKGSGFAGLVKDGERHSLRAVWVQGEAFLILDAPVDGALSTDLEKRMSIRLLRAGGRVESSNRGVNIEFKGDQERPGTGERLSGMAFFAAPDETDWATGIQEAAAVAFQYQPWEMVRRLSPGTINTADLLVKVLAAVALIFMLMDAVAVLLGFSLARSITRSVHALSQGTEWLRRGAFGHRIPIRSRDQLGELAESFNMMAHGIEDLLRESAEKERLEEELRIARQIQMSLLPRDAVSLPGLRVAALCLPAAEVGGDYYDLLPLSDSRLGVLVADVSGKGTSAALYMAELKGLVLSLSRIYDSPARLLAEANRILAANMDPRSFITMTYAVLDTEKRTMRFARAGHNPLIQLEAATGRTRMLVPAGLGLGLDGGVRFEEVLEEAELPLRSGDLFLFFTDGLSEAMNTRAELFGERRLRDVVEGSADLGSEEMKERILAEVRHFVGEAAQHDDMTMVILRVA